MSAAMTGVSPGEALRGLFGEETAVLRTSRVTGGAIHTARRLELTGGRTVFLKENRAELLPLLEAEVRGVRAIASRGVIGTSVILACGTDEEKGTAWLLEEWIEEAAPAADCWETFGRRMALLHTADASDLVPGGRYGLARDNYIGAWPQENGPRDDWASFYRDRRLFPLLKGADRFFEDRDREMAEVLLSRIPDLLPEPASPALLHGDLWSGNYMIGPDGQALLIDPAVYVGSPEAEIAMMRLWGDLPQRFYDAYHEILPFAPGFYDRKDLYDLYHMLTHLNMFGERYLPPVRRILERYAGR